MSSRFHFLASQSAKSQEALLTFTHQHQQYSPEEADILVILGGDGFMLQSLQKYGHLKKPFYGINYGTVGFLMNETTPDTLEENSQKADNTSVYPLKMTAINLENEKHILYAFNEISLLRQSALAAHIRIIIDEVERLDCLMCDGILVSTPAGSSAYNLSAHGPILPIGTKLLAMTPISPFRPRRWRGALLPDTANIVIEVLSPHDRPVNASADAQMIEKVKEIRVQQDTSTSYQLLFNPDHNLEDRLLQEQFTA